MRIRHQSMLQRDSQPIKLPLNLYFNQKIRGAQVLGYVSGPRRDWAQQTTWVLSCLCGSEHLTRHLQPITHLNFPIGNSTAGGKASPLDSLAYLRV